MLLDYINNQFRFYPDVLPGNEAKAIGGRYDKRDENWIFPPVRSSYYSLVRLYGNDIDLTLAAKEYIEQRYVYTNERIEYLDDNLYPYQKDAIAFLTKNDHPGLMLSLSPGLGKTLVSIAAAKQLDLKRILVICTLTLTKTWQDEIKKWSGAEALIIHGVHIFVDCIWTITNYDSVVSHPDSYISQKWDLVICDESILLKSRAQTGSKKKAGRIERTKIIKELVEQVPRVWLLSGSPISRNASDLWQQFNIMLPDCFSSYWRFIEEYCYLERTQWGTRIVGTKKNIDFVREFADIKFQVNKEDVLDLPEYLYETYTVELTSRQRQIYDELEREFVAKLDGWEGREISVTSILAELTRLQQIVSNLRNLGTSWPNSSSKADLLFELVRNEEIETPAIIWVNWVETGKTLLNMFDSRNQDGQIAFIYGDTPPEERIRILSDFKAGKINYLILTLGTGKYGLTLIEAKTIVYYDRSFDADAYVQSLERVSRIGLTHRPTVISLVCPGTVDELIQKNLLNKGFSMSKINGSNMKALFRSLKRERV